MIWNDIVLAAQLIHEGGGLVQIQTHSLINFHA
jgi:hypothetical protein